MNIGIVYYSYSGNTHEVAKLAQGVLCQRHSVVRLRLEAPKEAHNFFIQAWRALCKRKTQIRPSVEDLSGFDLIIFGTPVWAREMTPALRSYLDQVKGIGGKKAISFVTYGSGFGKEHCLNSLERILENRGARCIGRFTISQFRAGDRALIERELTRWILP